MTDFNFKKMEVSMLNGQELEETAGGTKTPWESIIENAGELLDTAAGFLDGLLGRHK